MILSQRLQYIIEQVPLTAHVIDVCADHSYAAIALAQKNPARQVIASDISEQPLTAGKKNAQAAGVTNITFRLGSGLSVLTSNDSINAAIISGIGGKLMRELLNTASFQINRYILQANNEMGLVRAWLDENAYEIIVDERIADHPHIYEIVVAQKTAEPNNLYSADIAQKQAQFYFGPRIQRQDKTTYLLWLNKKIKQLQQIKVELTKSKNADTTQKIMQYDTLIAYGVAYLTELEKERK